MAKPAELKFPWRQLETMLRKLGEEGTRKQMVRAMEKAGLEYEAEAVKLAPHDTGFLENSSTTKTRKSHGGIRTVIRFGANYAADVHELPPARRGKKTREKPATKFGTAGRKYLERVLRGMDFEFFIGTAFREVLKENAAKARRSKRRR